MPDNVHGEHDRGRDTRSRLRELALQLFAEQGYEKTSLREIAERLGVTKAALYYYFKSKEDIVRSLVEDYMADIDDLIAWGKDQPRTPETRAEIVRRYLGIVANGTAVFRLLHQNQAAVSSLAAAKERGRAVPRADRRADRSPERAGRSGAQSDPRGVLPDEHQLLLHALPGPGGQPGRARDAVLDVALELADAARDAGAGLGRAR